MYAQNVPTILDTSINTIEWDYMPLMWALLTLQTLMAIGLDREVRHLVNGCE